jgi:hypothetical protein
MWQIEGAALPLVIDRLEWALSTPLGREASAWCARVSRGLAQVRTALDCHAAQVESRGGLFARVADRDLLPFTEPVRQARALCQEHENLSVAVAGLQALLDDAARRLDSPLAAVRLHEVWKLGGELVDVLRAHLRTERCLHGHAEELQHTAP